MSGRNSNTAHADGWPRGWPNCDAQLGTTSGGGLRLPIDRRLVDLTNWLCDETVRLGYHLDQSQCGAYNCRPMKASDGTELDHGSVHSNGIAVDLNWSRNGYGHRAHHDIPQTVVNLWRAHGWIWGGDWTDYMHFEFSGSPADAARVTASLTNAPAPSPTEDDDVELVLLAPNKPLPANFRDPDLAGKTPTVVAIKGQRIAFQLKREYFGVDLGVPLQKVDPAFFNTLAIF